MFSVNILLILNYEKDYFRHIILIYFSDNVEKTPKYDYKQP